MLCQTQTICSDDMHSLVPQVQTLTTSIHYATSTESTHPHFNWVLTILEVPRIGLFFLQEALRVKSAGVSLNTSVLTCLSQVPIDMHPSYIHCLLEYFFYHTRL